MTSSTFSVSVSGATIPVRYTETGIVATITPDVARQLLVGTYGEGSDRNATNHPDPLVAQYARAMREGRFGLEGVLSFYPRPKDRAGGAGARDKEPSRPNDILVDGHRRLLGCVAADVLFDTYISPSAYNGRRNRPRRDLGLDRQGLDDIARPHRLG